MANNATTNYKFVKPDEDEFYDIQVQNGNWETADAALKEQSDRMDTAQEVIPVVLTASGWTGQSVFGQTVDVTGLTEVDCPQLVKLMDTDAATEESVQEYNQAFGIVNQGYGRSGAGNVSFYVYERPEKDIQVGLLMGRKGDGKVLMAGGGSGEKQQISNVVITLTDNAAVAEGGAVTVTCNNKSWTSTIKNGKSKLYTSEVGDYIITVVTTDAEPITYTTKLVCPYFGQFSTDIYSGTLDVFCTEAGGNGKTCQVRSCDDEYNPTDAYNLTQTFDTSLKLTFLGIPAGKYLVTVDDKYVFFKHIESIQNINSVNVCLRQYLYDNGNQCVWNTGGWIKCKEDAIARQGNKNFESTKGLVSKKLDFLSNRIIMSGSVAARSVDVTGKGGFNAVYWRGGGLVNANVGTVKPLPISAQKYTSLHVTGADENINYNIRVGAINDENTTTSTTTILQSGSCVSTELAIGDYNPYFVVGKTLDYPISSTGNVPGVNVNDSFSAEIIEIYLM